MAIYSLEMKARLLLRLIYYTQKAVHFVIYAFTLVNIHNRRYVLVKAKATQHVGCGTVCVREDVEEEIQQA